MLRQTLFLAVTDDISWTKVALYKIIVTMMTLQFIFSIIQENLRKHEDVIFSSDYSNKNNNELDNLSGDDFVGFDLCILSTRKTSLQKLNGLI